MTEPTCVSRLFKTTSHDKLTSPRSGAWKRPRPTAPTPKSRSSTASPNPAATSNTPKPAASPAPAPAGNVWAARAAQRNTPAGGKRAESPAASAATAAAPAKTEQKGGAAQAKHVPVNNFNEGEVREALGRGVQGGVYKVDDASSGSAGNTDGESKSLGCDLFVLTVDTGAIMANGKNFFDELAKQVAALQNKGK